MKAILGEYGRLIILIIASAGIFAYFFGTGFRRQLVEIKPKETLRAVSQSRELEIQQTAEKQTLTVKTEKLKTGECYDLLSFCTDAYGKENGHKVEIIQITDPKGMDLLAEDQTCDPARFVPEEKGVYEVVYQGVQWHTGGYPVQIQKTFRYLAV